MHDARVILLDNFAVVQNGEHFQLDIVGDLKQLLRDAFGNLILEITVNGQWIV